MMNMSRNRDAPRPTKEINLATMDISSFRKMTQGISKKYEIDDEDSEDDEKSEEKSEKGDDLDKFIEELDSSPEKEAKVKSVNGSSRPLFRNPSERSNPESKQSSKFLRILPETDYIPKRHYAPAPLMRPGHPQARNPSQRLNLPPFRPTHQRDRNVNQNPDIDAIRAMRFRNGMNDRDLIARRNAISGPPNRLSSLPDRGQLKRPNLNAIDRSRIRISTPGEDSSPERKGSIPPPIRRIPPKDFNPNQKLNFDVRKDPRYRKSSSEEESSPVRKAIPRPVGRAVPPLANMQNQKSNTFSPATQKNRKSRSDEDESPDRDSSPASQDRSSRSPDHDLNQKSNPDKSAPRYRCPLCDSVYALRKSLFRHGRQKHSGADMSTWLPKTKEAEDQMAPFILENGPRVDTNNGQQRIKQNNGVSSENSSVQKEMTQRRFDPPKSKLLKGPPITAFRENIPSREESSKEPGKLFPRPPFPIKDEQNGNTIRGLSEEIVMKDTMSKLESIFSRNLKPAKSFREFVEPKREFIEPKQEIKTEPEPLIPASFRNMIRIDPIEPKTEYPSDNEERAESEEESQDSGDENNEKDDDANDDQELIPAEVTRKFGFELRTKKFTERPGEQRLKINQNKVFSSDSPVASPEKSIDLPGLPQTLDPNFHTQKQIQPVKPTSKFGPRNNRYLDDRLDRKIMEKVAPNIERVINMTIKKSKGDVIIKKTESPVKFVDIQKIISQESSVTLVQNELGTIVKVEPNDDTDDDIGKEKQEFDSASNQMNEIVKIEPVKIEPSMEVKEGMELTKEIENMQKRLLKTETKMKSESIRASIQPVYKCESTKCNVAYSDYEEFKKHSKIHSALSCGTCHKIFQSRHSLKYHLKRYGHQQTKCDVCNAVFEDFDQLYNHALVHVNLKCDKCHKKVKSIRQLKSHLKKHEIKEIKCKICDLEFEEHVDLQEHNREQHETLEFYCKKCTTEESLAKKWSNLDGIKYHLKSHPENEFYCNTCDLSLTEWNDIREHAHQHSTLICDKCKKKFNSTEGYLYHKKTHDGKDIKCRICGLEFPNWHMLREHKPIHKSLICNICCTKKFNTYSTLRYHLRTLKRVPRLLNCDQCDKQLRSIQSLEYHLKSHETKHECNLCGKKVQSGQALKYHLTTHKGDKIECNICLIEQPTWEELHEHAKSHASLICEICDRKYMCTSSLKYHLQAHKKKDIEIKCRLCWLIFPTWEELFEHGKTHQSLVCEECKKKFKNRVALGYHLRAHQKDGHKFHNKYYPDAEKYYPDKYVGPSEDGTNMSQFEPEVSFEEAEIGIDYDQALMQNIANGMIGHAIQNDYDSADEDDNEPAAPLDLPIETDIKIENDNEYSSDYENTDPNIPVQSSEVENDAFVDNEAAKDELNIPPESEHEYDNLPLTNDETHDDANNQDKIPENGLKILCKNEIEYENLPLKDDKVENDGEDEKTKDYPVSDKAVDGNSKVEMEKATAA